MDNRIFLTEDIPEIFIKVKVDKDVFEIVRYKNTGDKFKQGWTMLYGFAPAEKIRLPLEVVDGS
jgi:hypothetical protein